MKIKPYWKKRTGQVPGYHKETAYTEVNGEMVKALDAEGNEITRERPNRALKRRIAADIRRGAK